MTRTFTDISLPSEDWKRLLKLLNDQWKYIGTDDKEFCAKIMSQIGYKNNNQTIDQYLDLQERMDSLSRWTEILLDMHREMKAEY